MIKLVASDLDGTLLLHKAQSLPEEIFSLIRQLEELGIMFVAASGRQYPNMTKLFAPVAFLYFGEWCTGSGSWRGTVSGFF